MPEKEIKLTGFQAIIGAVVLVIIFIIRIMTFDDQLANKKLMEKIELELTMEYFPQQVEELKGAWESGNKADLDQAIEGAKKSKFNILSVSTSYPLFKFTSTKEAVVRVKYTLDGVGNGKVFTNYYAFRYGVIGNVWQYQYPAGPIQYYLNFL